MNAVASEPRSVQADVLGDGLISKIELGQAFI